MFGENLDIEEVEQKNKIKANFTILKPFLSAKTRLYKQSSNFESETIRGKNLRSTEAEERNLYSARKELSH